MLDRFVRLCEIPSPTGSERAVADAVAAELDGHGIDVVEDDSGARIGATAGNLLARVPGEGDGYVMFAAHLDTVPHQGPIEVVDDGGVFRSVGETILGADNKAAVAVLVELLIGAVETTTAVGIELLLTVSEEDGLRGAGAFDVSQLHSEFGFVLDHASPIGEVAVASPTYKRLVAEFSGIEAHAGIRPEAGRSAIEAASAAIAAMELGRLDEETTANIGSIDGGSATNVVAGRCQVEAEARGIEQGRAEATVMAMVDACTWAAGEHGCDVDVEISEVFRGYRLRSSSTPLGVAKAALQASGVPPVELISGGGSDANALRAGGFDAILLANGTEANHTTHECVAAKELERMLVVCDAIVAEAARC